MSLLDEVQTTIRQLADGAGQSVVGIGQRWGVGSGIVLGDGRVLTYAHNVRGDQVTVTLADERTAEGTVAGHDIDGDLAVIEVDTAGGRAALGQRRRGTRPGGVRPVQPGAAAGWRVTFGFVSGIERTFLGRGAGTSPAAEHTAPLPPGSSGGPVLNADGQLLGINTNRLGEGFYLAIPADDALRGRVDALGRGESAAPFHRGWAWRWRPVTSPGGCAARSACRRSMAC